MASTWLVGQVSDQAFPPFVTRWQANTLHFRQTWPYVGRHRDQWRGWWLSVAVRVEEPIDVGRALSSDRLDGLPFLSLAVRQQDLGQLTGQSLKSTEGKQRLSAWLKCESNCSADRTVSLPAQRLGQEQGSSRNSRGISAPEGFTDRRTSISRPTSKSVAVAAITLTVVFAATVVVQAQLKRPDRRTGWS